MELDPWTIGFEIVNFMILLWLLRRYLFRPARRIVAQRREELEARAREIAEREQVARATQEAYESKSAALEAEANRLRHEARDRAEQAAQNIIDRAREEMAAQKQDLQHDLQATRGHLLEELGTEVAEVAVAGARRILEQTAGSDVTKAYARMAAGRLLEAGGGRVDQGPIRVWLPRDVDVDRILGVLRDVLGSDVDLEARTDERLLGGVRLLLQDIEVEASAGAVLDDWLADIKSGDGEGSDSPSATEGRMAG